MIKMELKLVNGREFRWQDYDKELEISVFNCVTYNEAKKRLMLFLDEIRRESSIKSIKIK